MQLLCVSKNDKRVVFDSIASHTATHFKDAPRLQALAAGLLKDMSIGGDLIARDIDMGKIVGDSDVVEIDDTDEVVYAMRKNREDQGYVPFTKSRSSEPSRMISVYLVRRTPDEYELLSAWIGEYESPMFPQMVNATSESIPYWSKHAFVWGSQEIIPGTEKSECPW